MTEDIERKAVEMQLENAQIITDGENCGYCCDDVNIYAIPAADVKPVIRGEWIGEDCSYWRNYHSGARPVRRIRYKCSVCGRTENQKEPFCNCGAKLG